MWRGPGRRGCLLPAPWRSMQRHCSRHCGCGALACGRLRPLHSSHRCGRGRRRGCLTPAPAGTAGTAAGRWRRLAGPGAWPRPFCWRLLLLLLVEVVVGHMQPVRMGPAL